MKKVLSTMAALTMLLSGTNTTAVSAATTSDTTGASSVVESVELTDSSIGRTALSQFLASTEQNSLQSAEDLNENVTLIVELTKAPLLDIYNEKLESRSIGDSVDEDSSYASFELTQDAISQKSKIEAQQDKVVSEISDAINDGKEVEVKEQYTVITNAIAIEATRADEVTIASLPNVKNVYEAVTYDRIDPETTTSSTSTTGTGASLMNADDLEYQGDGMVVAILDTGLDTSHEAFQTAPDGAKYSKSDIASILEANTLDSEVLTEDLTVDEVYINEKIPYVYDYADQDYDVNPTTDSVALGNDHGTHVAGIVASESETMSGVAPNAQLMIMKVFPDTSSGASEVDILNALEDCVTLDVDVINMSLGSSCGYTYDEYESRMETYQRIEDSGINLITAASNDATSAESNLAGGVLAENPDYGTVGSPSTYSAALSVASAENSVIYQGCIIDSNGNDIGITDNSTDDTTAFTTLTSDTPIEYVYCGLGLESDFADVDVSNKIALISRGTTTFSSKVLNAWKAGASGALIMNNTEGTISMSIDTYYIPAASITLEDGNTLKSLETKTITIGDGAFFAKSTVGQISDFSSWGATPDLKLKPEITAIGGDVYSTLPFGKYGSMGGTSMASPQMAGLTADMKQYLTTSDSFKDLSVTQLEDLSNSLFMSTATPMTTTGSYAVSGSAVTVAYSPRQQGAGLVNAANAFATKAYLYTDVDADDEDDTSRPVLNLGDSADKSGVYTKSFHLQNLSDEELSYELNSEVLTDEAYVDETYGLTYSTCTPALLSTKATFEITSSSNNTSAVSGSSIVVLGPQDDVVITVSIELTDEDKEYIDEYFENGEYIDGFITLDSLNDDGIDLSIPFLGFYGDWTQAPLLDAETAYGTLYDNAFQGASTIPDTITTMAEYYQSLTSLMGYVDDDYYAMLGTNLYSSAYSPDINKIAISPNGDGYFDEFFLNYYALRGAKTGTYTITDSDGNVLNSAETSGDRKSYYYSTYDEFISNWVMNDWDYTDKDGNALDNNSVIEFTFTGYLDYDEHEQNNACNTLTLPITIDTEAPTLINNFVKFNDDGTITISASDNQYIEAIILSDYKSSSAISFLDGYTYDSSEKGATNTATLDTSSSTSKQYLLTLTDYAGNTSSYIITRSSSTDSSSSSSGSSSGSSSNNGSSDTDVATTPTPTPAAEETDTTDTAITHTIVADSTTPATATRSELKDALGSGKNAVYVVNDAEGNLKYSWTFKASSFSSIGSTKTIDLTVSADSSSDLGYSNGVAVKFSNTATLPCETDVKVYVGDILTAGSKAYLYSNNTTTGKLDCVPNSTYVVDSDGYITLHINHCADYVVLPKAAASSEKTSVLKQVSVTSSAKVTKGNTKKIKVTLPETLKTVSDLSSFDADTYQSCYGATVTYTTSNKKVATVSANGKVTAKKAGKATITTTVTLSNGTSKTYKTTVKVSK